MWSSCSAAPTGNYRCLGRGQFRNRGAGSRSRLLVLLCTYLHMNSDRPTLGKIVCSVECTTSASADFEAALTRSLEIHKNASDSTPTRPPLTATNTLAGKGSERSECETGTPQHTRMHTQTHTVITHRALCFLQLAHRCILLYSLGN